MNAIVVAPILIPLTTAVLLALAWRHRSAQRIISVAGCGVLLVAATVLLLRVSRDGILVSQAGNWPAPFGISLVADLFSTIMVALAALMGSAVAVYSLASIDRPREYFGYHPLFHILLMGVCGAFVTGDLFNLFVWFEVLLIASFALMALGGERNQIEGSIKYVTLNLIASALFLSAVGIVYAIAGTLNMAELAGKLGEIPNTGLVRAVAMLFFVAFGIKAAVFPLFFWLPASYHTPPAPVAAIFSGLLTKVGVYALIRLFTLVFAHDMSMMHTLILWVAGFSMVTGVLGAVAQNEFRRILSFHIISQIGYMVMGLGLFTPLALAASVYYIIHHIIVKTNLFLVSGIVQRCGGSYELRKLGGLYKTHPILAVMFLIPALSLAGVPPLSGFFAKLALVQAGLGIESYVIVGVALTVSLMTLFSMLKIWSEAFWKPQVQLVGTGAAGTSVPSSRVLMAPVIGLAILTVLLGVAVEPVFILALRASESLMDPSGYIGAVMSVRR
jgi:multicomponent Na+:H+ antiporter subunit D